MPDDLSAYERQRLENIERNAAFLKSLGLGEIKNQQQPAAASSKRTHREGSSLKSKTKKRAREEAPTAAEPLRRSRRIKQQSEIDVKDEAVAVEFEAPSFDSNEVNLRYDVMPQESKQLDDFEFRVYAKMRKWRLALSRELQIEAYKVMQDRTICELIRRRRNDPNWAKENADRNDEGESDSLSDQLLECWGIGSSKASEGGFGRQAAAELDAEENMQLLLQSLHSKPEPTTEADS